MTDRDIVIALAEKVMGWKVATAPQYKAYQIPTERPFLAVMIDAEEQFIFFREDQSLGDRWNPLESISDAWMIVEKLRALDKYVRVEIRPPGNSKVDVWRHGKIITERNESVGRAICLAALKAVMEETDASSR